MIMDLVQAVAVMAHGRIIEPQVDYEDDLDYKREPDALARWMETELG